MSSGPASIIYNEGGQRAEEDDLDDDDPVASAYVSRGPSPPPAVETQLPVPERSYLEVPNATTPVRSSKSRGSPPELEGVDKGKGPEDPRSGSTPSRSLSVRNIPGGIPGGIEIPGPIALTDSNSSRRSGSGRLGETLTSIWGNTPPSAGPSANSSVLPSPLEGPSSRSVLLNALKPLASVPEGSAIPEVVHADPPAMGGVPEFYRASPPKTPKAETPHASASQSRTPVSTSAAATSPKPTGTPKVASRIPTAAASPRPGGTPRGLSMYSDAAQHPPGSKTPKGPTPGSASPGHIVPSTEAPPEQFIMPAEPEAMQLTEPATTSTPKPPTRVPTRAASPKPPTRAASPKPPSPLPPSQPIEPLMTESTIIQPDPTPTAPEPLLSDPAAETVSAEPAAVEEDTFGWGQPKSKAGSRKNSKAGSKAGSKTASKTASKAPSKAPTPKGTQTPKPPESTSEEVGPGASAGSPTVERTKPSSGAPSPLTTVPEHAPPSEPVEAPPGGFYVVNPDGTEPPAQVESTESTFPSFGSSLGSTLGGSVGQSLFGGAASALGGWGFGKKGDKSKSPSPKASTPTWGGFGGVPSVAESTSGSGKKEDKSKSPAPGWGGFGNAPSVAESTGGSNGGWGAATGNNGGSGSMWTGLAGGKSGNASTADLLDGTRNTDPLAQDPAEHGDPLAQNFGELGDPIAQNFGEFGDPLAQNFAEHGDSLAQDPAAYGDPLSNIPLDSTHTVHEGEMQHEDTFSRGHLTLQTDVPPAAEENTAEPTTAADDSPEVEREGDGGQAEEDPTAGWGLPVKSKKKKGANASAGAATPATQAGGGGGDDGFTIKKKKGKKGK